eukprot:jgi/Hompol1/436/HPOL_001744-RA
MIICKRDVIFGLSYNFTLSISSFHIYHFTGFLNDSYSYIYAGDPFKINHRNATQTTHTHHISTAKNQNSKQAALVSRQIDADLERDRKALQWQKQTSPKILILGSSNCGKSTLLKQLVILHCNGFTNDQRRRFRSQMLDNIVDAMKTLIQAAITLKYDLPQNGDTAAVMAFMRSDEEIPDDIVQAIARLWTTDAIKAAWQLGDRFFVQRTAD